MRLHARPRISWLPKPVLPQEENDHTRPRWSDVTKGPSKRGEPSLLLPLLRQVTAKLSCHCLPFVQVSTWHSVSFHSRLLGGWSSVKWTTRQSRRQRDGEVADMYAANSPCMLNIESRRQALLPPLLSLGRCLAGPRAPSWRARYLYQAPWLGMADHSVPGGRMAYTSFSPMGVCFPSIANQDFPKNGGRFPGGGRGKGGGYAALVFSLVPPSTMPLIATEIGGA